MPQSPNTARLRRLKQAYTKAQESRAAADADTAKFQAEVVAAYESGMTYEAIGDAIGVSRQRVWAILRQGGGTPNRRRKS
jgi:DNA-directed RNA polymerase specialized sigma24 family protein